MFFRRRPLALPAEPDWLIEHLSPEAEVGRAQARAAAIRQIELVMGLRKPDQPEGPTREERQARLADAARLRKQHIAEERAWRQGSVAK